MIIIMHLTCILKLLCYLRRRSRLCFYFGPFVCMFVCPSDNWKSYKRILTKFLGGVGYGPGTMGVNFGDDTDHRPDPGVRCPKSEIYWIIEKVPSGLSHSDESCIGNLHYKNHSAVLLCWRSAEVCAVWVLLVTKKIFGWQGDDLILKTFCRHISS